jgi:hypothetical protein
LLETSSELSIELDHAVRAERVVRHVQMGYLKGLDGFDKMSERVRQRVQLSAHEHVREVNAPKVFLIGLGLDELGDVLAGLSAVRVSSAFDLAEELSLSHFVA